MRGKLRTLIFVLPGIAVFVAAVFVTNDVALLGLLLLGFVLFVGGLARSIMTTPTGP